MFASFERRTVHLSVQVVGQCHIYRLHIRIIQQGPVIVCYLRDGGKVLLEPGERSWASAADRHNFRASIHLQKMTPSGDGTGELATHQSAANDAETNGLHVHITGSYLGSSLRPSEPRLRMAVSLFLCVDHR